MATLWVAEGGAGAVHLSAEMQVQSGIPPSLILKENQLRSARSLLTQPTHDRGLAGPCSNVAKLKLEPMDSRVSSLRLHYPASGCISQWAIPRKRRFNMKFTQD